MQGNNTQRVSTDRFGNKYQVIGCRDKKDTGFCKGYIELKGTLYKLEPTSKTNKEGVVMWVKVTEMKKNTSNNRM